MVAVFKPAGWLVHRTGLDAGETRFVMQALRDQLGRHVWPVHRLDKGTCGLLVMALLRDAARALTLAEVALPTGLDWTLFALWLSALLAARGEDLVRVKGVVATPAGRLLLQAVRKTVQPPEILPPEPSASDGTLARFAA